MQYSSSHMKRVFLLQLVVVFLVAGCAQTSYVMMDRSKTYPKSTSVEILTQPPAKPHTAIAILESSGPANMGLPDLLESMRSKAQSLGADAVIPTQDASRDVAPGVMYNPWLGGYQTIGGGRLPIVRGVAIKYQ